jgi:hypothetical protein
LSIPQADPCCGIAFRTLMREAATVLRTGSSFAHGRTRKCRLKKSVRAGCEQTITMRSEML